MLIGGAVLFAANGDIPDGSHHSPQPPHPLQASPSNNALYKHKNDMIVDVQTGMDRGRLNFFPLPETANFEQFTWCNNLSPAKA